MPQIQPIADPRETVDDMTETATIDAAIFAAEVDIAQGGQLHDAHEALCELRRKHFG